MYKHTILVVYSAVFIQTLLTSAVSAAPLTITGIPGSTSASSAGSTLTNALLSANSGIHVVNSSIAYQGTTNASVSQAGTYTNLSLAPSTGSTPTVTLPDGILLTSGSAILPSSNTSSSFSTGTGSGSNAALSALAGTSTNDANVLTFQFTIDSGFNSVSAQFVFGTDEYPDQSVTDIFGFFVDGVNYAKFANGTLIGNQPGGLTNFISNTSGAYPIEYDGFTNAFSVTGLLNASLSTHTISIGVADTSDNVFDSGAFIAGLKGTVATGGGINAPLTPTGVPEGGSTFVLLGAAFTGLAACRRRLPR